MGKSCAHTYDERSLPVRGGWTAVDRMRRGKPVVVHGDGTSLWVLTHARDFARGFAYAQDNAGIAGLVLAEGTEPFSPIL